MLKNGLTKTLFIVVGLLAFLAGTCNFCATLSTMTSPADLIKPASAALLGLLSVLHGLELM